VIVLFFFLKTFRFRIRNDESRVQKCTVCASHGCVPHTKVPRGVTRSGLSSNPSVSCHSLPVQPPTAREPTHGRRPDLLVAQAGWTRWHVCVLCASRRIDHATHAYTHPTKGCSRTWARTKNHLHHDGDSLQWSESVKDRKITEK